MAKQAYVYSGTDWVPLASEVTNLSNYYTKGEVDNAVAPMGLVHLNTTSFSGVSSQSLPDNTFTATYEKYKILMRFTNSQSTTLSFRFRTAGTDNSTANYNKQDITALGTSVSAAASTSQTSYIPAAPAAASSQSFVWELFRPQATAITTFIVQSHLINETSGQTTRYTIGNFVLTTSFDSLSVITSAGTISGLISVFGYNE